MQRHHGEGRLTDGAGRLLATALDSTGVALERLPDRPACRGLHEVKEFGPALRNSFGEAAPSSERAELDHRCPIGNWNRPTTQVDFVVLTTAAGEVRLVAELKVWDIGHQLFDLAKVSCLLTTGVPSGFLVCVARNADDFERRAGGVLFPKEVGVTRRHSFAHLIEDHRDEWRRHVGKGGPQPTVVPSGVATTTIASGVPIVAYPGHSARAVEVSILDPTPVTLTNGWPDPSRG